MAHNVEELIKLLGPVLKEGLIQCEKLPTLPSFLKLANPVLVRMTEANELAAAEIELLQNLGMIVDNNLKELNLIAKRVNEEKGANLARDFEAMHPKWNLPSSL